MIPPSGLFALLRKAPNGKKVNSQLVSTAGAIQGILTLLMGRSTCSFTSSRAATILRRILWSCGSTEALDALVPLDCSWSSGRVE